MTTLYAQLILTPTDHYVVRPSLRLGYRNCIGDSGFTFALSSELSQTIRITIDNHDQTCLAIAKRYTELHPDRFPSPQMVYATLQNDFINGIHLHLCNNHSQLPLDAQTISLVLPTALGIVSWDLGSLKDVLTPKPLSASLESHLNKDDDWREPLPWE